MGSAFGFAKRTFRASMALSRSSSILKVTNAKGRFPNSLILSLKWVHSSPRHC
uniref:Uncharacterized protein n=1 Tax=Callorhinchus milii TaxID=7868 RepID=A0A4W3IM69_CALMI